jgi:hypothetical protein
MCAQLDLKVMCKRSQKKKKKPSNFHECWSEVHCKNYRGTKKTKKTKKKTLMFECYNLVDPME